MPEPKEFPIHPGPVEHLERDQWLDTGLKTFSKYIDDLDDQRVPQMVESMAVIVRYRMTTSEAEWESFVKTMNAQQAAFTAFILACAQSQSRYASLSARAQLFVDAILAKVPEARA